jgi:hypothetical protein
MMVLSMFHLLLTELHMHEFPIQHSLGYNTQLYVHPVTDDLTHFMICGLKGIFAGKINVLPISREKNDKDLIEKRGAKSKGLESFKSKLKIHSLL